MLFCVCVSLSPKWITKKKNKSKNVRLSLKKLTTTRHEHQQCLDNHLTHLSITCFCCLYPFVTTSCSDIPNSSSCPRSFLCQNFCIWMHFPHSAHWLYLESLLLRGVRGCGGWQVWCGTGKLRLVSASLLYKSWRLGLGRCYGTRLVDRSSPRFPPGSHFCCFSVLGALTATGVPGWSPSTPRLLRPLPPTPAPPRYAACCCTPLWSRWHWVAWGVLRETERVWSLISAEKRVHSPTQTTLCNFYGMSAVLM